ncbi:chemotaxis protein MotB [Alteromonadaceae bacterium Bs31]|nr:chemotaxis protein MotB [Alteromonadaceae bacterium Bs31]
MVLRRRVSIETKTNHERWLVSYSDFITLLFAFFVVMYSVSQVNEEKYRVLSETFQSAFSQQANQAEPAKEAGEIASLQQLETELTAVLQGLIEQGSISVWGNEDWVEIEINSNVLFDSASADPSSQAQQVFSEVADVLAPFENAVAVSGHTDNIPIRNSRFASNWELSSARAVAVVKLLAYGGVGPARLSAIGYGEYQALADNSTEQGRAENRRVVLRVAKDKAAVPREGAVELMAQAGQQALEEPVPGEQGSPAIQPSVPQQDDIQENVVPEEAIEPIKLPNGGLLFTSDAKGRG